MAATMVYHIIYDGNCNLCVNLIRILESLDHGERFRYNPMQDQATLNRFEIAPQDCELGMILLNPEVPEQRWQGSEAAEEIGRLLPMGWLFVEAYRGLPGMKQAGDRFYEQLRDHRYRFFGKRATTYQSVYAELGTCESAACESAVGKMRKEK